MKTFQDIPQKAWFALNKTVFQKIDDYGAVVVRVYGRNFNAYRVGQTCYIGHTQKIFPIIPSTEEKIGYRAPLDIYQPKPSLATQC